jgi:hypothetical protein
MPHFNRLEENELPFWRTGSPSGVVLHGSSVSRAEAQAAHREIIGKEASSLSEAVPLPLSIGLIQAMNAAVEADACWHQAKRAVDNMDPTTFRRFLAVHGIKSFEAEVIPGQSIRIDLVKYEPTQSQIYADRAYGVTPPGLAVSAHEMIELSEAIFLRDFENWRMEHLPSGFIGTLSWKINQGGMAASAPRAHIMEVLQNAQSRASLKVARWSPWKEVVGVLPEYLQGITEGQAFGGNVTARPNCMGHGCMAEILFKMARCFHQEHGRELTMSDTKDWVMFKIASIE